MSGRQTLRVGYLSTPGTPSLDGRQTRNTENSAYYLILYVAPLYCSPIPKLAHFVNAQHGSSTIKVIRQGCITTGI
jgi:hypothetical protein